MTKFAQAAKELLSRRKAGTKAPCLDESIRPKNNDDALATMLFTNTIAQKTYWPTYGSNSVSKQFHNGDAGYLEPYLGDSDSSYICPASTIPDDFGLNTNHTTRRGTYQGFTFAAFGGCS